jgi:Zn-dependent alcohol dehydrogenase
LIDRGANQEAAVIATVGTPGASTATAASLAGAMEIIVADRRAFATGQAITIDAGATYETAVVADIRFHDGAFRVLLTAPLKHAHAAGVQVSGTGLILQAPLKLAHPSGSQVTTDLPTPGAPNRYSAVRQ